MPDTSPTSVMSWSALIERLDAYAVFTIDTNGMNDSWNLGVGALLGYTEAEWVGRPSSMIFTPEDRAKRAPQREMETAARDGRAQDNRWHLRNDGTRLWVNGVMTAIRDDAGRLVGYLKVMRDETEAKATEDRLHESEERFAKAFRSNPTPVAILSLPGGRIAEVNDAFTAAFRTAPDDVVGRTLPEVGVQPRPEQLEGVLADLRRHRDRREEITFARTDGDIGHGTFAFEPVELGGEPHAVMLMHDVTEWRQAQDQLEQERRFVTATLASLPGIFYMLDGHRYVRWNDDFERVSGYGADEIPRLGPADVVVESEAALEQIDRAFQAGRATMEGHLRSKDGTLIPYLFTGQRVILAGKPYVVGVGLDIREQHRTRDALERRAREQSVMAELAASTLEGHDLQATLDGAVRLVADTLGAERVHVLQAADEGDGFVLRAHVGGAVGDAPCEPGTTASDAGRRPAALADALHRDSMRWPDEALRELGLRSGIAARIRGPGRPFGLIEASSPRPDAFGADDEAFLRSVAALLAGAIEQCRLHDELAHKADHDVLTGLPNRAVFETRLDEAIDRARRGRAKVAVLFLDLDRFKNINDSLGHQAGDDILRSVAGRVQEAVRSWDTVARLGGDEFVLFLPDVHHASEIAHVTGRLLEAFEAPISAAGRDTVVRTTIGIAVFPDDGRDGAALLRAADTAMYEGKASGRSSYHFFTGEQNAMVSERLTLETEVRHALARGELEISYQPILEATSERITAVEALLRWRHPRRGRLLPRDFIPVAEAIGLAVPIGEWTLREAFRRHATWRDGDGSPLRIAVNVATPHFVQPSFPATVAVMLAEAGLAAGDVELEITEDALEDDGLARSHLEALGRIGLSVVLDDFGSGSSSLLRLRELPIAHVKIDRAFTRRTTEPDGRATAGALVRLATSLGFGTVAEGIESAEQYRSARDLGFDAVQGDHLSPPRSPDDMDAFLRDRRSRRA